MSGRKSSQGNRVAEELEALRSKHLTQDKRSKLKDFCSPLTTPEQAQAFLAEMRDRQHHREFSHQPPTSITADSMEAWYLQQKQREKDLRQRRREAEEILRGYRGGDPKAYHSNNKRRSSGGGYHHRDSTDSAGFSYYDDATTPNNNGRISSNNAMAGTPLSAQLAVMTSESLDDPNSFSKNSNVNNMQFDRDGGQLGDNKDSRQEPDGDGHHHQRGGGLNLLTNSSSDEEKKVDDDFQSRMIVGVGDTLQVAHDELEDREITLWLDFVSSEPGAKFPPEAGRYHLYLSYACPGSHRVLIVRALKGLEDCISVTYVHPTWRLTHPDDPTDKHRGWVFGDPDGEPFANTIGRGGPFPPAYEGNEADPSFNAFSIREIYEHAKDTSGKYTIPLLWDSKQNTIVNNESSDIAYMLNSSFNEFAKNPDLDLYTEYDEEGVAKLNEVSEWLAPLMIHGVYRCGFAKTQRAYNRAIGELCEAFDRADDILQSQRYLTGDALTDADIRLFVSLLRFDEVYAVYFKANARLVMLTPNLLNFCRDIYQIPGVAETCSMEQIKAHFYGSHAEWNKYSVIPRGLGFMDLLHMPHGRDRLILETNTDDALLITRTEL